MPKQQLILPGVLSVVLTSLLIIAIALSPRKEATYSPMPPLEDKIIQTSRDGGAIASAGEKASKLLSKSQRTQLYQVLLNPLSAKLFKEKANNQSPETCEDHLDYELLSEPQAVIVLGKVIHHTADCQKQVIAFFEMDKQGINVRGVEEASYLEAKQWLAKLDAK